MKKYLIALMVLVMALALVACGGETADTTVPVATDAPETEHVHNFVEEIIPATCMTTGKAVTACACGEVESEKEIPLADHTASALDCEKDTVCTVCNTVLAEKTGHTMASTEVVVAASCTTGGKEKGVCAACGKIVETETPVAGHKTSKESVWTITADGYNTTCVACNQAVTMKEADVIVALDFETEVEEAIAAYPGFKAVGKFTLADDTDGDKALKSGPVYLDILDNSVFANKTILISFDVMTTKDAAANSEGSVFSILGNYENEKPNIGGTTSWGYAFKYNQELKVFETVKVGTDASKLTAENSIAVERGTKYNVKLIIAEGATKFLVIFNDKIYSLSEGNLPDFTKANKHSIRFYDGPNAGLVFDNFKVVTLK